jgi:hypothetical protein
MLIESNTVSSSPLDPAGSGSGGGGGNPTISLTATAGVEMVTLDWTASNPVSAFSIYRGINGGGIVIYVQVPAGARSYADTGAPPGGPPPSFPNVYTYFIRADY